jgi:translation elongation factor EF-Tu-like GTPase
MSPLFRPVSRRAFAKGSLCLGSNVLSMSFFSPQARASDRSGRSVVSLGHFQCGKTTLLAALLRTLGTRDSGSKFGYDNLKQPSAKPTNGLLIAANTVQYSANQTAVHHTDCHQHDDHIKHILSRSDSTDCAILVVSADKGPEPQTRQHVLLASKTGIPIAAVYINKTDAVTFDNEKDRAEYLALVESDSRDLLGSALLELEGAPAAANSIRRLVQVLGSVSQRKPPSDRPGTSAQAFKAEVYFYSPQEGGQSSPIRFPPPYRATITIGNTTMGCEVSFHEGTEIVFPGSNVGVTIKLDAPALLRKHSHFSLGAANTGVGIGVIAEVLRNS